MRYPAPREGSRTAWQLASTANSTSSALHRPSPPPIPSGQLVKEAREQAGLSRGVWSGKASTGAAKAAPEADPPPPLEGDDGPPPLV